jgi:hypothetical protein
MIDKPLKLWYFMYVIVSTQLIPYAQKMNRYHLTFSLLIVA